MKRIVIVIAAALLASVNAFAQPGIIAGLTSSTTSVKDVEAVKSINTYHAGVTFKANLGLGFAIQPSLIYQVKGSNLGDIGKDTKAEDFQLKTGFVEVPVQLQWGPDLLAFRPYLFVEPYLGYSLGGKETYALANTDVGKKDFSSARNKLEYGVGAGLGVEIASHVQISCQLFRNMGPLYNKEKVQESYRSSYDHLKNYQGIKINLAILF